jgi:CheY-like chemotaxis protein
MENQKYRVIFMDDDTILHSIFKMLFEMQNINVDMVESAEQALELIKNNLENDKAPYDIYVIDIYMKKMSGIEFLKTARQENLIKEEATIIIYSNQDLEEVKKQTQGLGMDKQLLKIEHQPKDLVQKIIQVADEKNKK